MKRNSASLLLLSWLKSRLEPSAYEWLLERHIQLSSGVSDKLLYEAFGQALRHVGKSLMMLDVSEQREAFELHRGWDLGEWTRDQAARGAILLSLPQGPRTVEVILSLFQTADMGEHLALARSLFLLPDATALLHIGREGVRSNMRNVFEAISQRNPYPAEHFDDIAWNQMVVKCLFMGLPLRAIYDLDRRNNADLNRILIDLAHERRAAKRTLSPEVLRFIGPFANEDGMKVLCTALTGSLPERRGAALGLWSVPDGKGRGILASEAPEFISVLENGTLNWENYDA